MKTVIWLIVLGVSFALSIYSKKKKRPLDEYIGGEEEMSETKESSYGESEDFYEEKDCSKAKNSVFTTEDKIFKEERSIKKETDITENAAAKEKSFDLKKAVVYSAVLERPYK